MEVRKDVVLPVVSRVLRNHDKAVLEVVEDRERHRAAIRMNGVRVGADVDEIGRVQLREGLHFPRVA